MQRARIFWRLAGKGLTCSRQHSPCSSRSYSRSSRDPRSRPTNRTTRARLVEMSPSQSRLGDMQIGTDGLPKIFAGPGRVCISAPPASLTSLGSPLPGRSTKRGAQHQGLMSVNPRVAGYPRLYYQMDGAEERMSCTKLE